MFVTDSGALLDPSYFTLASPLPLQYEEGSIIEVLAETSEKVGQATTSAFGASGLINLLIGASLSALLGQVKILQLVVYAMGLNLIYPVNLIQFNTMFIGLVQIDLLPSDEIYDSMIEFTETEASHPRLAMLKIESQNFLLNSGTLFIFLALWTLAFIMSSLLTASLSCITNAPRMTKCANWLDLKLKWNLFFDLLFAAQVELLLSAAIQFEHWRWELNGDRLACVCAVLTIAIFAVIPLVLIRIMKKYRDLYQESDFVKRYGFLTEGLRTSSKIQLAYQFLMMARRVCLVVLLFLDDQTAQLQVYRNMMIFIMIYVGQFRPSLDNHVMELINEIFLLAQADLMPVYTEFVGDAKTRHDVGWVSAGLFASQAGISFIAILALTTK